MEMFEKKTFILLVDIKDAQTSFFFWQAKPGPSSFGRFFAASVRTPKGNVF